MQVVSSFRDSKRRLFVLGYNATLTTAVEAPKAPKRHYDQLKAISRVNPKVVACIEELAANPNNVVLVFSGSECYKLEETFAGPPVWLGAENGVYLRPPWNRPDLPQVRCGVAPGTKFFLVACALRNIGEF